MVRGIILSYSQDELISQLFVKLSSATQTTIFKNETFQCDTIQSYLHTEEDRKVLDVLSS